MLIEGLILHSASVIIINLNQPRSKLGKFPIFQSATFVKTNGFQRFIEAATELFYNKLFLKFCNMHRKTPVLESIKATRRQACNFIKKWLQRRCFLVKIAKFLRTPVLENIWERLLLDLPSRRIPLNIWNNSNPANICLFKAKRHNSKCGAY